MKRKLAHGMRRTARALITQSNKLDPSHREHVHVAFGNSGAQAGADFARRIRYAGQNAGMAVEGALETLAPGAGHAAAIGARRGRIIAAEIRVDKARRDLARAIDALDEARNAD